MRKLLLGISLAALSAGNAHAADMAIKAPALQPVPYCTLQSCTGLYGGFTVAESGGSFNVISSGLGGIASNNLNMGGDIGYEIWNGTYFLAAELDAVYGVVANGNLPGGGNTNQWGFGALGKVGYNLSSLCVWDRPWGAGFASGAGVQALLAANWTLSADYIHVNYNNANINPNLSQQTEDMVKVSVDRHF